MERSCTSSNFLSAVLFGLATILSAAALAAGPVEFTAADAQTAYAEAVGLVTNCTPRDAGTPGGRRAAEWICAAARKAGANAQLDSFVALSRSSLVSFVNVIAEFPGAEPSAPWIVLISHFDTVPGIGNGFQGANDGASTTGLLLAFARSLSRAPRLKENVMLVWTDAEECRISYGRHDGFQGSRHVVEQFAVKRRAVKAAICLDMLGDRNCTSPCREMALRRSGRTLRRRPRRPACRRCCRCRTRWWLATTIVRFWRPAARPSASSTSTTALFRD
ncbi:MAG: M28 family peptidase [Kiritimatiellae bacterium]|nr:M28 family peptidase [Kiritimatiellia bacterium]